MKATHYANWDAQNFMVMAWIVNSMEEEIRDPYLCYSTAKELWNALTVAFSNLDNSAQLFELRNKARNLCQGDLDVTLLQLFAATVARNRRVCSDKLGHAEGC